MCFTAPLTVFDNRLFKGAAAHAPCTLVEIYLCAFFLPNAFVELLSITWYEISLGFVYWPTIPI